MGYAYPRNTLLAYLPGDFEGLGRALTMTQKSRGRQRFRGTEAHIFGKTDGKKSQGPYVDVPCDLAQAPFLGVSLPAWWERRGVDRISSQLFSDPKLGFYK